MPENNTDKAPITTGPSEKNRNPKKKNIEGRLFGIAAVLFFIVILVGMFLPAVPTKTGPAVRTPCMRNLRQISLAMLNYSSSYGHLPPAYIADEHGKPMHSWRVLLLPFLEQEDLYKQYSFEEPWDGPNNSKLHDEIVKQYRCPKDPKLDDPVNGSSYMVVTGQGTAFDGDHETTGSEVRDGMSNTLLLVEVRNPETHWMEPVDITLINAFVRFTDGSKTEDCCNHTGEINFTTMDGSTHRFALPISAGNLKALVMIDDGEVIKVNDL